MWLYSLFIFIIYIHSVQNLYIKIYIPTYMYILNTTLIKFENIIILLTGNDINVFICI